MLKTEGSDFQTTVRALQLKFTRFYALFLARHNLTFSQFALTSLAYHSGTVPMSELANGLMISLPAVTHLVDKLEASKFVKRVPHSTDRRVTLIELTEKGREAVARTQGRILELFLDSFKGFSPEEQKVIQRFYIQFAEQLEKQIELEKNMPTGRKAKKTKP